MLLEEFLEPMGMSQAAFAQKIGWSRARLNELIRGKRGVTAEAVVGGGSDVVVALGCEICGGTTDGVVFRFRYLCLNY